MRRAPLEFSKLDAELIQAQLNLTARFGVAKQTFRDSTQFALFLLV